MDDRAARACGALRLDETGEWLHGGVSPAAFVRLACSAACAVHVGPEESRVEMGDRSVWGERFVVTLRFSGPRLRRAELFLALSDDPPRGAGWESWTEERELRRKAAGEAWVERTFGAAMTLRRFEIDGAWHTPADEPTAAREAEHPWGRAGSFYDARGGMAFLMVEWAD